MTVTALCFDVFGTAVDWRSSIIAEGQELGRRLGVTRDWAAFADAWRGRYQPSMEEVRSGRVRWKPLDELHLESLIELVDEFDLDGHLDTAALQHLNRAWHRLTPWPEVVAGLNRLARSYTLATLSNANIELATNMAANAGLPWHLVLGAEVAKTYKPKTEVYLQSLAALEVEPGQAMMVAAHNYDLRAASALGMSTAFVRRPVEYGPDQRTDLAAEGPWDIIVEDFTQLADALC